MKTIDGKHPYFGYQINVLRHLNQAAICLVYQCQDLHQFQCDFARDHGFHLRGVSLQQAINPWFAADFRHAIHVLMDSSRQQAILRLSELRRDLQLDCVIYGVAGRQK